MIPSPSPLLSNTFGSTNGADEAWQNSAPKEYKKLLGSLNYPVYHTSYEVIYDMGYDHRYGCRAPYVDSRLLYVWTVDDARSPVLHMYTGSVHKGAVHGKQHILDAVEECTDRDKAEQIYDALWCSHAAEREVHQKAQTAQPATAQPATAQPATAQPATAQPIQARYNKLHVWG